MQVSDGSDSIRPEGPGRGDRNTDLADLLVGERAYKMKRAVRLPYVDFSTSPKRERSKTPTEPGDGCCRLRMQGRPLSCPAVTADRQSAGVMIAGGLGTGSRTERSIRCMGLNYRSKPIHSALPKYPFATITGWEASMSGACSIVEESSAELRPAWSLKRSRYSLT